VLWPASRETNTTESMTCINRVRHSMTAIVDGEILQCCIIPVSEPPPPACAAPMGGGVPLGNPSAVAAQAERSQRVGGGLSFAGW